MVSSFMEVLPVARIKFKQVEGQALPLTPGPSANSLVMTSWRHCPSCSTKHSIQPGDQQTAAQNMSFVCQVEDLRGEVPLLWGC